MRFDLVPWGASDISIGGEVSLTEDVLACSWSLAGPISQIVWPRPETPNREMGLWEHTCFEFFIGPLSEPGYCEFNLSPSGHWNAFRFDDVREKMRETPLLECLQSSSTDLADEHRRLDTIARFDAWRDHRDFRLGISAVIEFTQGAIQYFALCHPGGRPDFHARASHELYLTRTAA